MTPKKILRTRKQSGKLQYISPVEFGERFTSHGWPPPPAVPPIYLSNALRELAELDGEARESGLPAPTEDLKRKAEAVLLTLPRHTGLVLEVYSLSEGEIVLSASSKAVHGSVLLTLHPSGVAWCNARIDGRARRAWYPDTRDWPDGFVKESLGELVGKSSSSAPKASTTWSDEQSHVRVGGDNYPATLSP